MLIYSFRAISIMSEVELNSLPPELLLKIFAYVGSKEICQLSETCTKFKDMIDASVDLLDELTLYVNYPKDIKSFAETMSHSTRPYKNLKITRSSVDSYDPSLKPADVFVGAATEITHLKMDWKGYLPALNEQIKAKLTEAGLEVNVTAAGLIQLIFRAQVRHQQQAGHNHHQFHLDEDELVDELMFRNIHIREEEFRARILAIGQFRDDTRRQLFQEFVDILGAFNSLKSLRLSEVPAMLANPTVQPLENLSTVQDLFMESCDQHLCPKLLMSCLDLKTLVNSKPVRESNQSDEFEKFLFSRKSLKQLKLSNLAHFVQDRAQNIQFKLTHLKLNDVMFHNMEGAERFFASQDRLEAIDLHLWISIPRVLLEPTFSYSQLLKTSNKKSKK